MDKNDTLEYNVDALLDQMSNDICKLVHEKKINKPYMVGIHTTGVWIAQALYDRLHKDIGIEEPLGTLNSSYYRDDFNQKGLHKHIKPSDIAISLEGRHIILIDDILFTGRTVRAAVNELFDYGRLASVTLAVLIDRKERELPIEAQVVGFSKTLSANQSFKLINSEKLRLEIHDNNSA